MVHFALSENAHYSQNVQDLCSCILKALGFCRSERPKRAQMNRCPANISHRPVT